MLYRRWTKKNRNVRARYLTIKLKPQIKKKKKKTLLE